MSTGGNSNGRKQKKRTQWFRNIINALSATNPFKKKKIKFTSPRYDESNVESALGNVKVNPNMSSPPSLRWFIDEETEVYSFTMSMDQFNIHQKRMNAGSIGRDSAQGSRTSSSKMFMVKKALNEDVENKFPDEIFVSHMTEIFYYPFLIFWQVMLASIIVLMIELIAYNFIYTADTSVLTNLKSSDGWYFCVFAFNVVYLLDVTLSLVHRLWPEFELKMHYKVRPASWLICDCIILLPLLLDSYLFVNYQYILHIVQLLAIYRVYSYFASLKKNLAYSVRITILMTLVALLFIVLLTSSILYLYSCLPNSETPGNYGCGKGIFVEIIGNATLTEFDLFCYSQYFAFFLLPPQREAILFEKYYFVRLFYIFMYLITCAYIYFSILPDICWQHFLANQRFNEYCLRRFDVVERLTALKYNKIIVQRIAWFYAYAWMKRMNLDYAVNFQDIPPQMARNLCFDIFFEALSHSDLFRFQEHDFLRVVANRMVSELHMEGDIIFGKNGLKSMMIYVVQGSVEVLSAEDDTTPLMVFGNGTLLGESCIHISYFSNFILRCRSPTCELHVLRKVDFLKLSVDYKKCREIMTAIEDRYTKGRMLADFSELINEKLKKTIILREQVVEPTAWLKSTTLRLLDLHYFTGERMSEWMRNLVRLDCWYKFACHTTDHLMMLAIPQGGMTTTGDPILLRIQFPLVFRPDSTLHDHWNTLVFILVIILAIILPYTYSFSGEEFRIMSIVPVFYQCIFVVDIILQISTGIQTHDGYITDIQRILQYRIQQTGFIIDLVAVVPVYMFQYLAPKNMANLKSAYQINQLLKLWKVGAFLENKWTAKSELHFYLLRLFKFIIYYTFMIYFSCSLLFSFLCYNKQKCLIALLTKFSRVQVPSNASNFELFSCGMYRMVELFLGIYPNHRNSHSYPSLNVDFYLRVLIRLMACFMQIYILSSLIELCVISHQKRSEKRHIVKSLRTVMSNFGVKAQMVERAVRYNEKMNLFESRVRDYTKDLPPSFRVETKLTQYVEDLAGHPLFTEAIRDFIIRSARMCSTVMLPEREVAVSINHMAEEMFFVKRGCLVVTEGDGVGKIIKPGQGIGVIEVCLDLPYRRTLVAITDCELIQLTSRNFKCARLRIVGATIDYDNTVDTFRKIVKGDRESFLQPPLKVAKSQIGLGLSISRVGIQSYTESLQDNYVDNKLKPSKPTKILWKILSFFQIRNTIHPDSKFLWGWEISRWFVAVLTAVYFPLDYLLRQCFLPGFGVAGLFLYGMAIVDIYIRLHIAYYDPVNNILITNRVKTAYNYYSHGLLLDIICIAPIELIPENKLVIKLLMRYNKVLSVYRFNLGMMMLSKRYDEWRQLIYFIQYTVILYVMANALAPILISMSCNVERGVNKANVAATDSLWSQCVLCANNTWPTALKDYEAKKKSSTKLYFLALYWAVSMLTCNSLPFLEAISLKERTISLFVLLLGCFINFHFCAQVVAIGLDSNNNFSIYQKKARKLIKYMKDTKIPKYIVRLVRNQVKQVWSVSRNKSVNETLEGFPKPLHTDILMHIYYNLFFQNAHFSSGDYWFYETLFHTAAQSLYVSECNIILTGDVTSQVYFLVQGTAELYDANDEKMFEIGPGSVFGAVEKCKYKLVNYSIVALTTVHTLKVSSITLHNNILTKVDATTRALFTEENAQDLFVRADYNVVSMETVTTPVALNLSVIDQPVVELIKQRSEKKIKTKFNDLMNSKFINSVINGLKTVRSFVLSNWAAEMVFFCWASCILCFYTIATCDDSLPILITFYLLDILKSLNIIYTLVMMKSKKLYTTVGGFLTGAGGVLVNIIMVVPADILFILIFGFTHFAFLARLNRIIGVQYILKYWRLHCKTGVLNPLPSRVPLKYAYFLLLIMSLFLVFVASVTYFLHDWERAFKFTKLKNKDKGLLFINILACVIGIRVLSSDAGAPNYPYYVITFVVVILYAITRTLIFTVFLTLFYVNVFDRRFMYPEFWHRYKMLMAFLKDANTTSSLLGAAKRHMELNWVQNRGECQPLLMFSLPFHLRAAINNYAYGKYVFYSDLFSGCSLNFLRQISAYLTPMVLYSGDIIVATGTSNYCMYFITYGVVVVNDTSTDCTVDVLYKWDSFGLTQGIDFMKFGFDYVAYSQILILQLHRQDWEHLIPFYPDDYKIMQKNLEEIVYKQSTDQNRFNQY